MLLELSLATVFYNSLPQKIYTIIKYGIIIVRNHAHSQTAASFFNLSQTCGDGFIGCQPKQTLLWHECSRLIYGCLHFDMHTANRVVRQLHITCNGIVVANAEFSPYYCLTWSGIATVSRATNRTTSPFSVRQHIANTGRSSRTNGNGSTWATHMGSHRM